MLAGSALIRFIATVGAFACSNSEWECLYALKGQLHQGLLCQHCKTYQAGARPKLAHAWCRIGDVYPDNMVQVSVRMYLYRWIDHAEEEPGNSHFQASLLCICLVSALYIRFNKQKGFLPMTPGTCRPQCAPAIDLPLLQDTAPGGLAN